MQRSESLAAKVSPRLTRVRNARVRDLKDDFLRSVEKVINELSDDQLAEASLITISYQTFEDNDKIYRSNYASVDDKYQVKFEDELHELGTKAQLDNAMVDFKGELERDTYVGAYDFEVEKLLDLPTANKVNLDFMVFTIEIKPRSGARRKIVIQ